MALPNFLVIGAQRAGTTWLDSILRQHPDIYLPVKRKEIHFFDRNFAKGVAWYENFFPDNLVAGNFKAIGEITPSYLFDPCVPPRIKSVLGDARLVAILRNPTDRAFSQYGYYVSTGNTGTFRDFMSADSTVLDRGRYGTQLRRFADYLTSGCMHVIIFEELLANTRFELDQLARFLDVDPERFAESSFADSPRNATSVPRYRRLRRTASVIARFLRKNDLDAIANLGKRVGSVTFTPGTNALPTMATGDRDRLMSYYESDIEEVESLLDKDLSSWKFGRDQATSNN